jgi:hypothetical protein
VWLDGIDDSVAATGVADLHELAHLQQMALRASGRDAVTASGPASHQHQPQGRREPRCTNANGNGRASRGSGNGRASSGSGSGRDGAGVRQDGWFVRRTTCTR